MSERGRARRRDQRERVKAKVERILRWWGYGVGYDDLSGFHPVPLDARMVGMHLNSGLRLCSCWMCGNARRHQNVLPAQWARELGTTRRWREAA